MSSTHRLLVLALGCMVSAAAVQAEQASTAATASERQRSHERSPETAAALSAGIKFNPVKPKEISEDDEVDLRERDKPRNEIIRLPKFVVNAKKPPVFNDRSLYTKGNLEKLAMSRYLSKFDRNGLNRWTIPGGFFSNEARAMDAYLAQERLENMADVREQERMYQEAGDGKRAAQARNDAFSTFIRVNEESSILVRKNSRF